MYQVYHLPFLQGCFLLLGGWPIHFLLVKTSTSLPTVLSPTDQEVLKNQEPSHPQNAAVKVLAIIFPATSNSQEEKETVNILYHHVEAQNLAPTEYPP